MMDQSTVLGVLVLIAIPSIIGFVVSLRRFLATSSTGFGLIFGGFFVLLFGVSIGLVGIFMFPMAFFQDYGLLNILFGIILFISLILITAGVALLEVIEGYY